MSFKTTFLGSLYAIFLVFSCANAFNITEILKSYKDFGSFNDLLTKSGLAPEINSRNTITILAVENSVVASLSGTPPEVLKNVLSVHVVLDYYDMAKLQKLANGTAVLTTLFQSSGQAKGQQGFLNAKAASSGAVVLASAAPGSPPGATVAKTIVSQPYNVSVLQVSHAIVPAGITTPDPKSAPPPGGSPAPATGTAKPPPKVAPATAPAASSPAPPDDVAPAPGNPAPAGAPKVAAPAADGPVADGPADDGKGKSAGEAIGPNPSGIFVIVASLIFSLALMI